MLLYECNLQEKIILINVSAACHIIIIPPQKKKEEAGVTTDVPDCGINLGCGPMGKEPYSNVERNTQG
jgi:hypothetical protein